MPPPPRALPEPKTTAARSAELTPTEVVEQIGPAVVTVINEQQFDNGFAGSLHPCVPGMAAERAASESGSCTAEARRKNLKAGRDPCF